MPFTSIAAISTIPDFDFPPIGPLVNFPCPPGTRCVGITLPGGVCIGPCVPITGPTDPFQPPPPLPPPNGHQAHCTERLAEICRTSPSMGPHTLGDCNQCNFEVAVQLPQPNGPTSCPTNGPSANGCGCCTPLGKKGSLNKSRYYQFGDCRTGTRPGVVDKGTKCVAKRRTNFGNGKAARRAVSRLQGSVRLLRDIEHLTKGIGRRARARRR